MNIRNLYNRTVDQFRDKGIPDAELEAELLLRFFLDVDRIGLFLDERRLSGIELKRFDKMVARRLVNEPSAYIIGEKEFWSLPFGVCSDVLIPRPETEFLVENLLSLVENSRSFSGSILELGAGSGIISVVLALELPKAGITAVEKSGPAINVATENIARHGMTDRINLIKGDWFTSLREETEFDFIVSNPPYVAEDSRSDLQPELDFEPREALFAGRDGMNAYKLILSDAGKYLKKRGFVLLEIGSDQAESIKELFDAAEGLELIDIKYDYAGLPRIAIGKAVDGKHLRK